MQTKPRSIKAKRENAYESWEKWRNGEISGAQRDEYARHYIEYVGMETGTPEDADKIMDLRRAANRERYAANRAEKARLAHIEESKRLLKNAKRQKSEKNQLRTYAKAENEAQKAAKFEEKAAAKVEKSKAVNVEIMHEKDGIRKREETVKAKLNAGELRILSEAQKSIASGKRTVEDVQKGIQKWKDATERTVRKAVASKEAKQAVMKQANYRQDNDRQPGIEWKGGQLRSGDMSGQKMPAAMAANQIVDKYHRSSMIANNIVPNLNIRGENSNGEIIDGKIPAEIVQKIYEESKDGKQPDPTALIAFITQWGDENDIIEGIDIFADDADLFDT